MAIIDLLNGLNFRTGADFGWRYAEYASEEVSCASIRAVTKRLPFSSCQMLDLGTFSQQLIDNQAQSEIYQELFDSISSQLTGTMVFKIQPALAPNYNYDIYIAGMNADKVLVTLYSAGIETGG